MKIHQKAIKLLLTRMNPELDTSEILEGDMAGKYLTMVGQLQWLVTLWRFGIHAQVATICRIFGAYHLEFLLQYVNWLVWEVCSVN